MTERARPDGDSRRALAVSAHPDDVDFGAAGTVARWVAEGWDVRYLVVTSGQRGGQDARVPPAAYGVLREAEQRAAAGAVGVSDVTFLGYPDSAVRDTTGLRRDLAREFRRHRPHRLLTMDPALLPTDRFVNHPDHRAVGTAALDVTMTGGTTAMIFPELLSQGLAPWRALEETWLMGPAPEAVAVDVSATVEHKLAALRSHASQVADPDALRARILDRLRDAGRPHGLGYAETFRVLRYLR